MHPHTLEPPIPARAHTHTSAAYSDAHPSPRAGPPGSPQYPGSGRAGRAGLVGGRVGEQLEGHDAALAAMDWRHVGPAPGLQLRQRRLLLARAAAGVGGLDKGGWEGEDAGEGERLGEKGLKGCWQRGKEARRSGILTVGSR